ncbi:hypothetical protein Tco_1092139 [Tanacetum coccineum]|uniref:Uncharacterized protein n=1 Tax=Tanacetum coccineum TaxID=301880 RepID=A0ABQ5I941_9ASTR
MPRFSSFKWIMPRMEMNQGVVLGGGMAGGSNGRQRLYMKGYCEKTGKALTMRLDDKLETGLLNAFATTEKLCRTEETYGYLRTKLLTLATPIPQHPVDLVRDMLNYKPAPASVCKWIVRSKVDDNDKIQSS